MHLIKSFKDHEYPADSHVSVLLSRSDYKVMLRAMIRYLDYLMEVKYKTGPQLDEKEVVNDILWSFHQEVGPNLFWDD